MRLIDADKLPYEDIESVDGNTYMCVNAYDIEHAPTVEMAKDCISRADALEEACEFVEIGYNGKGIFRRLKELPSVTPSYNSVKPELDCISREYLLDRWFTVFNDDGGGLRVVLKKDIEDAPSVATLLIF